MNKKILYKDLMITLVVIYLKATLYVMSLPALLVMTAKMWFDVNLTVPFYVLSGIWTIYFLTVAYRAYKKLNGRLEKGVC